MQTLQMNLSYAVFILLLTMIVNSSDARKNDSSGRKSAVVVPQALPVKTTLNSSWSWANPIFRHAYNDYSSYYDVFEIVAPRTDRYTFSTKGPIRTYGYLYRPPFNPGNYEQDLLADGSSSGPNGNFEFTHDLQMGVSYNLVVTTENFLEIGDFQVVVTGTSTVALTRITVLEPTMPNVTFKSMFTNVQPQLESYCDSSDYYSYDIFSVVAQGTGNYTIETVSGEGVNIRLYSPSFDPLGIVLNIRSIDETYGYSLRQQLLINLVASNIYYIVLSKFDKYLAYDNENYRFTFRGPSQFTITKLTNNFVSIVKASSALTKTSPLYPQAYYGTPDYYYKVFVIKMRQFGIYTLLGYSQFGLSGYLFDPRAQFAMKVKLRINTDYYFVVSTRDVKATGVFNITGSGPQPFNISAVPDGSNSTLTLSSSITSRSSRFTRCDAYYGSFYYRLFDITVQNIGLYTIKTVGSIDTFGCLYRDRFNPAEPGWDLFSFDDQSGGKDQFAITTVLQPDTVYYLAVSTSREGSVGSFKVTASGPAKMTIVAADSA